MVELLLSGLHGIAPTLLEGLEVIKKKGWGLEVEFTHGINIKKELAEKIGEKSKITLTVHAPYFINLNSLEPQKIKASKARILRTLEYAELMKAKDVVIHAGFYMKKSHEEVYEKIKEQLIELQNKINEDKWKVRLSPETMGKLTQFGNLNELLNLMDDVPGLGMTVDFSHLWAVSQGKTKPSKVLEKIEERNKNFLKNFHGHFSGIVYGEKGEKYHVNLQESDFPYKNLAKALNDFKVKGSLVCESPDAIGDIEFFQKLV